MHFLNQSYRTVPLDTSDLFSVLLVGQYPEATLVIMRQVTLLCQLGKIMVRLQSYHQKAYLSEMLVV